MPINDSDEYYDGPLSAEDEYDIECAWRFHVAAKPKGDMVKPQAAIAVKFVEQIPDTLKHATLYVSEPYRTAIHLCACGCGSETVTPLGDGGWTLSVDGQAATLSPSIGNFSFPCRSHYWIRNGAVEWCG